MNGNGFSRFTQSQTGLPTSKVGMNHNNNPNTFPTTPPFVRINDKLHLYPRKILSKRADGIIYEGIYFDNGMEYPVSIKEINFPFLGADELTKQSLLQLQHRNMIKYHTVCFKKEKAYIVMDLHTRTLDSFLREDYSRIQSSDHVLSPLCKSLLYQLCSVIVYLQTEENITHCDLLVCFSFLSSLSSIFCLLFLMKMGKNFPFL